MNRAKKTAIARGLAEGKSQRAVAEEVGVGQRTVEALAQTPEVMEMRERIEREHEQQLRAMYGATLESVTRDITDGDAVVRREARRQALGILQATDRRPQGRDAVQETKGGMFTLDQVFAVFTGDK